LKICGVVQAKKMNQILSDIEKLNDLVDLIEIRLDYREEQLDLAEIHRASKKPLIATNRSHEQGGVMKAASSDRLEVLVQASELGYHFIDIELDSPNLNSIIKSIKDNGSKVIGSHHDFNETPSLQKMESLLEKGKKADVDLVKIIGTANTESDNFTYLNFNLRHPGNISFGMGEKGVISRVISPLLGSAFTYASLEDKKSAPGQLSISSLKKIYSLMGVYD
jgi:3-dehydroquinate dehydratase type I